MHDLPQQWRELSDYHRDILFTVYQDGGRVGADIFGVVGECEGRAATPRFYERLNELEDWGFLRSTPAEHTTSNSQTWHITAKGDLLIETVQDRWKKL